MPAHLVRHDAEKMQRIGIVGLGRERVLEARFGFVQSAGLELCKAILQANRRRRGARITRSTPRRDAGTPLLAIH
jgi:hypothetical protein